MRFRVLEENEHGEWFPITIVFEWDGRVHRFATRRTYFPEVPAESLEAVTVADLDYEGEFRLGPVQELELPSSDDGPPEFSIENHLNLLEELEAKALAR
ncbi:MAG: hypothetical protein HY319_11195 [Armatimonadetes bacterium]|nr:hypothetical protein [Armatimonadota bacterium]